MIEHKEKTLAEEISDDPELQRQTEREWFVDGAIIQIEEKMEQLGITRKTLAERLECSPANVTQLLRHGSNLTLGTLMDVALAIGHRFLSPVLVPVAASAPWESSKAQVVSLPQTAWVEGEAVASGAYRFYAVDATVSSVPSLEPYSETISGVLNA